MTSFSCESDSAEQASTTADEEITRRSTSFSGSSTDTDSNNELAMTPFPSKNLTTKDNNAKKYSNSIFINKKMNIQSDTETRNLLDDVGEDFDEDYNLNLQESEIELDFRMFDLSDDQLNYYTNCFLYLMQKTQGYSSMNGAIQGVDKIVLDFFRKSRLDDLTLSKIWSLSDVNEDGFLNLNEFINAMHLIVLHVKCNITIPAELPHSIRPVITPIRTLVRFEDGVFGAFPESRPNSAINSSTKITSECISSGSGDSQKMMTKSLLNSNENQEYSGQFSNIFKGNNIIKRIVTDISTNSKQHSFSDDHLHSSKSIRHDDSIAKFSDVPPLLVDGHPLALNVVPNSNVASGLPHLLASTARGPPPQPPYRDYNEGTKGHGRSVSLDLKTFSALSSFINSNNKDVTKCSDEIDGSVSNVTTIESTSSGGITNPKTGLVNKFAQTEQNIMSTSTQTGTGDCDYFLSTFMYDLDTINLTIKDRCKILQQVNERLEMDKSTLMQIRLQVQLRIEETIAELEHFDDSTLNVEQQMTCSVKPTNL